MKQHILQTADKWLKSCSSFKQSFIAFFFNFADCTIWRLQEFYNCELNKTPRILLHTKSMFVLFHTTILKLKKAASNYLGMLTMVLGPDRIGYLCQFLESLYLLFQLDFIFILLNSVTFFILWHKNVRISELLSFDVLHKNAVIKYR